MGLGLRDVQYASLLEFAEKLVNFKTFFFKSQFCLAGKSFNFPRVASVFYK